MIRKLYLEGEAHALLMAGLESFRASNMYVCACTYMCTREMWTTSRHIWLWAASVPLLPIYMTMTRSDSIVSSLWTFNSQMSQLSGSRARHNAKTSGTWSKIPAKVSQCSKPPSNVSCLMAAHSQVRSINARIYCGFEIKKKMWAYVPEMFRSKMRERYDLRDVGRRLSEMADMVRAVLLICGYI